MLGTWSCAPPCRKREREDLMCMVLWVVLIIELLPTHSDSKYCLVLHCLCCWSCGCCWDLQICCFTVQELVRNSAVSAEVIT